MHQGTVTFEGVQAKILHWSDTAIQVAPVDAQAKMPVHLTVLVYSDKEKQIGQAGAYYETLPPLDPPSGLAGATVTINGTGFSPTGKPWHRHNRRPKAGPRPEHKVVGHHIKCGNAGRRRTCDERGAEGRGDRQQQRHA